MIGNEHLPLYIKSSVATAEELPHKINDLRIQAMVNEYLQELAAFGRIDDITLFINAINNPTILKTSRKVLAMLEKRNLLPYTLPDNRGLQLAFATAIAQAELNTARVLYNAIIKSLPSIIKAKSSPKKQSFTAVKAEWLLTKPLPRAKITELKSFQQLLEGLDKLYSLPDNGIPQNELKRAQDYPRVKKFLKNLLSPEPDAALDLDTLFEEAS